jgi:hypothetical protein
MVQMEHKCKLFEIDSCICSSSALEPESLCPFHGGEKPWPPRCESCGKFVGWNEIYEAMEINEH